MEQMPWTLLHAICNVGVTLNFYIRHVIPVLLLNDYRSGRKTLEQLTVNMLHMTVQLIDLFTDLTDEISD